MLNAENDKYQLANCRRSPVVCSQKPSVVCRLWSVKDWRLSSVVRGRRKSVACSLLSAVTALILISSCVPAMKQVKGPMFLHTWLFRKQDTAGLIRVVDSSHLPYTYRFLTDSDGSGVLVFRFMPDPSSSRIETLFARLKRYTGMRGFATTRGQPDQ